MSRQSRRERNNVGGTIGIDRSVPGGTAASAAVINVERLLVKLLRTEVDRLVLDETRLTRYFEHLFAPLVEEGEVAEFVTNFIAQPPKTIFGYARSATEFPCFAVVLADEAEDQATVGDDVGQGDDDDPTEEYEEFTGATWSSTFSVFVYAQHPDVCLYLYQFAKMLLHSGKELLLSNGVLDVVLSGGELAPNEMYLPDTMFCRVLNVRCTSVQSFPRVSMGDPRRMQITGLYRNDVVVDGVPGGVSTPEGMLDDDDAEDDEASLDEEPEW